ncbi:hypothetical protein ACQP2U_40710 [Nocardia sp. CA-084685]|uniref:hypothetical protein n=1 Tax=Nocardia sp. CA-084685 TaxID=3239970 RepID=UPI003D987C87
MSWWRFCSRTGESGWQAVPLALSAASALGLAPAGPWLAGLIADRTSTAATLAWTAVLCTAAAAIAVTEGNRLRRSVLSARSRSRSGWRGGRGLRMTKGR